MKKINKIQYILLFIIIYILLTLFFINSIGQPLINLQLSIIKSIFANLINYSNFIFVPHCSGILSIITYLSLIIPFLFYKVRFKVLSIIKNIAILLFYNFFRLITILLGSLINNKLPEILHIFSWFFLFFIIFYMIREDLKNKNLVFK
jgi:exosortase/archaeosortase family protein